MKKYMPLEGLRWSRDSGSTLCDTPQNGRSRTGWGRGEMSFYPSNAFSILVSVSNERFSLPFSILEMYC